MAMISTKALTHVYGEGTPFRKAAISDISVDIEKGEFLGIIGHTGRGKSTLIQHFNGLLRPTSGEIFVDGKNIWSEKSGVKEARGKVGLVFQYPEYQLFEETVYKDIAYGPSNLKLTAKEIDQNVMDAAQLAGITGEMLEKSPFELSGGQKRRVAIAGVMAMKPEVLVLDEPTAGLDPRGRDEIFERISDYHRRQNSTVILVSHSMEDIAKHCSKVLVMNRSEVFMYGTVDEVFERANEISQIGLEVPQITKVFMGLRERGFSVGTSVFTVTKAVEEIKKLYGGGVKNAE
jgi:energy-coupling factor transport system ATP-binding protein